MIRQKKGDGLEREKRHDDPEGERRPGGYKNQSGRMLAGRGGVKCTSTEMVRVKKERKN